MVCFSFLTVLSNVKIIKMVSQIKKKKVMLSCLQKLNVLDKLGKWSVHKGKASLFT